MKAQKVDYLKGNIYYIYDSEGEQIATVNDGDILWEDGDKQEPWRGATNEVEAAVAEAE